MKFRKEERRSAGGRAARTYRAVISKAEPVLRGLNESKNKCKADDQDIRNGRGSKRDEVR
jgi:hypothetical protein